MATSQLGTLYVKDDLYVSPDNTSDVGCIHQLWTGGVGRIESAPSAADKAKNIRGSLTLCSIGNSYGNELYLNFSNTKSLNLRPVSNSAHNLGESNYKWKDIWGDNYHGKVNDFDIIDLDAFITKGTGLTVTFSSASVTGDYWYVTVSNITPSWHYTLVKYKLTASYDNKKGAMYIESAGAYIPDWRTTKYSDCNIKGFGAGNTASAQQTWYFKLRKPSDDNGSLTIKSNYNISGATISASATEPTGVTWYTIGCPEQKFNKLYVRENIILGSNGIETPNSKLEVRDAQNADWNSPAAFIANNVTNGKNVSIKIGKDTGTNYCHVTYNYNSTPNNQYMRLGFQAADNCLIIKRDGKVGIGTNAPTATLHVSGDSVFVGSVTGNAFYESSDIAYKTDIKPLINRGALKPVEFTLKKNGERHLGFIAQDVQKFYPELVGKDADDKLVLSYPNITAVLAAQVNELKEEVSLLKELLKQHNII